MHRRQALHILAAGSAALASGSWARAARDERRVVLYSSMDDHILREVVAAFEARSGLKVAIVGDTEATKTTGLVQRLIAERERPRADVWWSSEPFGSIRLAQEGILEPSTVRRTLGDVDGSPVPWPERLRDPSGAWHGFACRARVVACSTARWGNERPAIGRDELIDQRYRGKIGIARPQFGTTRGHLGAILAELDEREYKSLLQGLKDNKIKLYDGNAAVVRGIAQGEIDLGLTDTDDVYAAQREGWKVGFTRPAPARPLPELLIPCTAGLVRGGPNPKGGTVLLDDLLSPQVELMLARGEAKFMPIRQPVIPEFKAFSANFPHDPGHTDLPRAESRITRALELWDEVFGR